MLNTDISKELKCKIETNQNQLKEAIRKHQKLLARLKESDLRFMKQIQDLIEEAQQQIIIIGLEQKGLVEKLRKEYKCFQRTFKANVIKNGIEERRVILSNSITRARKQNIIARSNAIQSVSPSEESEVVSSPPTPEPIVANPINPQDLSQTEFLAYFGLVTHDVYKEIQTKRAERKRRRTANPQFLYTRGWDISKRKRNQYLASSISPPNTRQSTKNKRVSSPSFKSSRPNSPVDNKKSYSQSWSGNLSAEIKTEDQLCSECNKPDDLLPCEGCKCAFHLSCHNRPLAQTPKHCPKCLKAVLARKAELNEKLAERARLAEKNKELTDELNSLQNRHSDLEDSLKTQDDAKNKLHDEQQTVEMKIDTLRSFITTIQELVIPDVPKSVETPPEEATPEIETEQPPEPAIVSAEPAETPLVIVESAPES